MIPKLRNIYEGRFKELNLLNLSKWRMRGNLIVEFKIFKGFDDINTEDYFTVDQSNITKKTKQFNDNW